MIKVICDVCEVETGANTVNSIPANWSTLSLSGTTRNPENSYSTFSVQMKRILCPECTPKIFNFDDKSQKKDIKGQLMDALEDFLADMVAGQVDDAIQEVR